jgi:hypothetical protein
MKMIRSTLLSAATLAIVAMPTLAAAAPAQANGASALSLSNAAPARANAKVHKASKAGGWNPIWLVAVVAGVAGAVVIATQDPKDDSPDSP